jgi:hypothetical protein
VFSAGDTVTGDEHAEPARLEEPASGICRKLLVCD